MNKSRTRNKSNRRNPNLGNVINRVFDSSGPDGKVRGTPAQVIEKYEALARDAQLYGDRITAENFHQHGEHYIRILNEAQREANERREAQEAQRAAAQNSRDEQISATETDAEAERGAGAGQKTHSSAERKRGRPSEKAARPAFDMSADERPHDAAEVIGDDTKSGGLIDTPEDNQEAQRSKPRRAPRRRSTNSSDQQPKDAKPMRSASAKPKSRSRKSDQHSDAAAATSETGADEAPSTSSEQMAAL